MAVLIIAAHDRPDWWARELTRRDPGLDVRVWPEIGDPADIAYVLAWKPPPGVLATLPNLAVVFSLGAGVDHLFEDPDFPAHAAVVRVIDAVRGPAGDARRRVLLLIAASAVVLS